MLASQLIFNIKNLRAGGIQSDDENLSDRQIAFIIDYHRVLLMRQEEQRNGSVGREDIQDLGKVSLIQADPHECGCSEGDCILRTELPVPKSLRLSGKNHGFLFVGMYGGMSWQESTWNAAPWTMHDKYTGRLTKWFIKGRYMYILNPTSSMLSYMNVQGVFEDPRAANEYRNCGCEDTPACSDGYDYEYPISAHLVDTLTKMILESEIRWSTMIPADMTNDSQDTN